MVAGALFGNPAIVLGEWILRKYQKMRVKILKS